MSKNIVLIGFMGSGKTLISRALGAKLNREVLSTDALIEQRERRSITQIFNDRGEAYFRQCEGEVIKDLVLKEGIIIDCGGGLVLNPNFPYLRNNGIIIHIKAEPEVIYNRLKGTKDRPLLDVPNPLGAITELYTKRLPLYKQADLEIDANAPSIDGPVDEILQRV